MSKGFASNYRIVIIAFGVLVCFAGIGTRLVYLHVIDRAHLVRYVDKARRQISIDYARRGDVLDSRGDVLATSRSIFVVGVDPQMLRKEDEPRWPELARLLGVPLRELELKFTTKYRAGSAETGDDDVQLIQYAKLSENVGDGLYEQIKALKIEGVYGTPDYRRTYPRNQLAAHILGYINKEGTPVSGVERYADFWLRGQNGWRESEKDGHQRELAQFRSREVPATDGYHVVLSLDSAIQRILEVELERAFKDVKPQKIMAMVTDARTGFILALANYPTFNLNEFNTAPIEVQRNFAVTDQFDPGSTFKIVAASGALNEGSVHLATPFDCMQEVVEYKGKPRRLMEDDHRYDHPLTVAEIISHSSNRGAARLAMVLGDQKFYQYARRFGFGEETGFPFGGEISGQLHAPEKWSGIDITRIPAGYSISATPMQIHYAMGAIASGGELHRPQIIREVRDSSGEPVYRFGAAVKHRVITEKTAELMAAALHGVMLKGGTGDGFDIPGYQLAGKTGTAQKLINGQYSSRNHVGSYVGFFPASAPRVVISVIVDDGRSPTGGPGYGRAVAAPSFKRVAEQLIQYLDIKPVEAVLEPKKPLFAMQGGRP
jgi:cell division protein FtsI/penicillin-binding protein 2